jgi:hypothetical protein
MGLLYDLADGKKREITKQDYYAHLTARPPVAALFPWGGERWDFGYGDRHIYGFKIEGDKYYAQKTDLLNPYECGISLKDQLRGKVPHLQ